MAPVQTYKQLIRELASRNLAREPMTRPEIAVVMTEYPDVVAEALDPQLVAYAFVTEVTPTAIGQTVIDLLRAKCLAYVFREVESMREQLRQEEAEDREFEREAV